MYLYTYTHACTHKRVHTYTYIFTAIYTSPWCPFSGESWLIYWLTPGLWKGITEITDTTVWPGLALLYVVKDRAISGIALSSSADCRLFGSVLWPRVFLISLLRVSFNSTNVIWPPIVCQVLYSVLRTPGWATCFQRTRDELRVWGGKYTWKQNFGALR